MKAQTTFIDFVLKEWLLVASGVGLILTTLYIKHLPPYSPNELEVLFILFTLFVTVHGLQRSGLISSIARRMESGRALPLKLLLTTFFLSMVVTNDVALIVMVPITLSLNINRKDILVIFEALAANSGSALTPMGNPQNLYIYWFYNIAPDAFIETIAPFSMTFLFLLLISSFLIHIHHQTPKNAPVHITKQSLIYSGLLLIVLLTVFRILPVLTGIVVLIFALLFDRKTLRIDYALLFSFLFFFGIADNLKRILGSEISHSGHTFLFSALASQIMSNVPATLLFAKFTTNWQALLWGVNAGGFGSLFGSLANLIAYKLYVTHENTNNAAMFTVKFLVLGYAALLVSIALYFVLTYGSILGLH